MNRDKVILSIVVAAYNSENTIRRCIDSILNQKFTDFELIIVNDGSISSTHKKIDKILREIDF